MSSEDKSLLREVFGLNNKEMKEAESLYHSENMGVCECGSKIMSERNKKKA